MELFKTLVIETEATCNRACPTCLRQTYPKPISYKGRMPTDMVYSIIDQAVRLDFHGRLCLQFFNEPLLDPRVGSFAAYAKTKTFSEVMVNTNGDLLLAQAVGLDGVFDRLHVALYGDNREIRKRAVLDSFKDTRTTFTSGQHFVTHYSPFSNLQETIDSCRDQPCRYNVQDRMIIAHTGEMRLCCEDIGGEWDLGNLNDNSLKRLWFGHRHAAIVKKLSKPGGRVYPYCQICPCQDRP